MCASAVVVAKVISGLGSTGAIGVDGIPVSVLKKGAESPTGPISHVINRSLATGTVPTGLKTAIVIPVFKGGGKDRSDPGSYRPVSLLPAISKAFKLVVMSSHERHLSETKVLPSSQYRFRLKRSCSTAPAAAYAGWLDCPCRGACGLAEVCQLEVRAHRGQDGL
jgi:hypothetical protein